MNTIQGWCIMDAWEGKKEVKKRSRSMPQEQGIEKDYKQLHYDEQLKLF